VEIVETRLSFISIKQSTMYNITLPCFNNPLSSVIEVEGKNKEMRPFVVGCSPSNIVKTKAGQRGREVD